MEALKQEIAKVNIDILGITELKWTVVGECNSDDNYIYYYGQESFRRNGLDLTVNKRVKRSGGSCLVTKSCPNLATPWTVACQAPLPRGFSRQEYWRRVEK